MPHVPGTIRLERAAGVAVVVLVGEHDMATTPMVSRRAQELACEPDVLGLVVDLAETTYLDSSVLNLLVRLRRERGREGQPLAVHVPPDSRPWRILRLAGLLDVLPLAETREGAIALVERAGRRD